MHVSLITQYFPPEIGVAGLPVIASNIGGIPEVVIDQKTGILVEPNSVDSLDYALLELIKLADLRRKYGSAGKELVKNKYLWQSCVSNQINDYKNLLGIKN